MAIRHHITRLGCFVFVLGLGACPDPETPADPNPDEASLTCGPGTTAKNGVCTADETDNEPAIVCEPGTRLNAAGTGCIPDIECTSGTEPNASGTGCVQVCEETFIFQEGSCVCPAGLAPNSLGNACELDAALCGEGTIFVDGACVALTPPPVADDDLDPTQAPVFFDLPGVDDKPVELGGIIDSPTREDGSDLDVYRFNGQAGDRLLIQTVSFGAQGASFMLTGIDEQNGDYMRLALPLYNRRAAREVVLPTDGRYAIVVSDRTNVLELFGVFGIPVGGPDQTYGLVVDAISSPTATPIDADGESQSGLYDDIDAYRIRPESAALGEILYARIAANEEDPSLLTQPVLWYVDSAGEYQEFTTNAAGEIRTFVPQLGSGMVLHVDYAWRLDGAPDITYDLQVLAPELQDGPLAGGEPVQGSTEGDAVTFFPVELQADHVYRMRMELPSSSTIPNASFILLNSALAQVEAAESVTVGTQDYAEIRMFAGPDNAGLHYLTVLSADEQEPLSATNFNVRWTLDEAPVIRGTALPNADGTQSQTTLPAPSLDPDDDWTGPWVLTTINEIGRVEMQTTEGVDFESFDATDFSSLVPRSDAVFDGACSIDDAEWLESSQRVGVNLGLAGDDFTSTNLGCGVGSGGDFTLRLKPQPAGVTATVTVTSEADTSVGFQTTCDSSCTALSDFGYDGDPETAVYTFSGEETGPVLIVIDSWFGASDDVLVDIGISGSGDDPAPPLNIRAYDVKGGDQVLVRTFAGPGSGDFVYQTEFSSSMLPWESEPNNAADVAGILPTVPRTWVPVEEGACASDIAMLPMDNGIFVWDVGGSITNNFEDGAWDDCGMSGVDGYARLPAQPEGSVTTLRLGLASDSQTPVNSGVRLALLQSDDCDGAVGQCLGEASTANLNASNGLELSHTWGADESDLIVLLDSTAQANEVEGARLELSVSHSHLPEPDLVWNGLIGEGDADWWRMEVGESGRLQVYLDDGALPPSGDVRVQIYEETGSEIIAEASFLLSSMSEQAMLQTYVMPGIYYAVITLEPPQELSFFGSTFIIGGQPGSYAVSWRLVPSSSAPSTCEMPIVLPGPGEYVGNTSEGFRNWQPESSACTGGAPSDYTGSDVVYSIVVPPETVLRASATRQDTSDPVLALLDGDCNGACLIGSDDYFSAAATESILWPNDSSDPQTFLLVVDTWGGDTGAFQLDVEFISTLCSVGEQRCSEDGYREVCAGDGSGFERAFCAGGCVFDAFELTATCNPYCGSGTDLPPQRCNGDVVEDCSADGERYEEQLCDVTCAQFVDAQTSAVLAAQCALGVCQPYETTCAEDSAGLTVASSCTPDGGSQQRTSCAAGCSIDGSQCAPVVQRTLSEVLSTGTCPAGTTPGDIISESGRVAYLPAGNEGNDFDDTSLACGIAGVGADIHFRLAAKPAGTEVSVRAQLSGVDLSLGFQMACDDGTGTCAGATDQVGAGEEELATYTYDGSEAEGVLVILESDAETWTETLQLSVDFSDGPLVPTASPLCTPDSRSCADGKRTTCDASGLGSETVYCAGGCDDNGIDCAPTPLLLGDTCASALALPSEAWSDDPPVYSFNLSSFADDYRCSAGIEGGRDGVFSFVASDENGVAFSFEGAPLLVGIYEGGCEGTAPLCVAAGTDGSLVDVQTQVGTTYFVVVDQTDPNDDVSDLRMRVQRNITQ